MVTIQPFEYEKTTAFKERVQIANKVNEIINLFNELDIESKINIFNEEIAIINTKITEINNAINEVNTAVNTVEGYNTRLTSVENESISLDARLDNIEPVVSSNTAKIRVLENNELQNVKLNVDQSINSTKYIKKIESSQNVLGNGVLINGFDTASRPTGWYKIYQIPTNQIRYFINIEINTWSNNNYTNGVANLYIWKLNANDQIISKIKQFGQTYNVRITQDANYLTVWIYNPTYRYCGLEIKRVNQSSIMYADIVTSIFDGTVYPEPSIDDYTYITTPTVIE